MLGEVGGGEVRGRGGGANKECVGEGGVHTQLQELPDCCITMASETFEAKKKRT